MTVLNERHSSPLRAPKLVKKSMEMSLRFIWRLYQDPIVSMVDLMVNSEKSQNNMRCLLILLPKSSETVLNTLKRQNLIPKK